MAYLEVGLVHQFQLLTCNSLPSILGIIVLHCITKSLMVVRIYIKLHIVLEGVSFIKRMYAGLSLDITLFWIYQEVLVILQYTQVWI